MPDVALTTVHSIRRHQYLRLICMLRNRRRAFKLLTNVKAKLAYRRVPPPFEVKAVCSRLEFDHATIYNFLNPSITAHLRFLERMEIVRALDEDLTNIRTAWDEVRNERLSSIPAVDWQTRSSFRRLAVQTTLERNYSPQISVLQEQATSLPGISYNIRLHQANAQNTVALQHLITGLTQLSDQRYKNDLAFFDTLRSDIVSARSKSWSSSSEMNAEYIQALQSSTSCREVVDLFVEKLCLTVQVPRRLSSNGPSMTILLAKSETLQSVHHIPQNSGVILKMNTPVQETSYRSGTDNIRHVKAANRSKMQTERVQNLQLDGLSNIPEDTLKAKFSEYKNQKLNEILAVIEQFRSDGQHIAKLVDGVNVYLRERQISHKEELNKISNNVNSEVNFLNEKLSKLGQRLSAINNDQLIGHPNERTSAFWRTTRHLDDIWTLALRLISISREPRRGIVAEEFEQELKHLDWITSDNGSSLETSLSLLKSIRAMTPLTRKVFPLATSFYTQSSSNFNTDFDDNENSTRSCDDSELLHAFCDENSRPDTSPSKNFQEGTFRTLENELLCYTKHQEATLPVSEDLSPTFEESIHVYDRVWCLIVRVTRLLMTLARINYCGILAWQLSTIPYWFQCACAYVSNAACISAWLSISWFQATLPQIEFLTSVYDFAHLLDRSRMMFLQIRSFLATCNVFTARTPMGCESEALVLTSNPSSSLASFGFVYHISIRDIFTNESVQVEKTPHYNTNRVGNLGLQALYLQMAGCFLLHPMRIPCFIATEDHLGPSDLECLTQIS
ncbi:hypothetical protein F5879DRAFT_995214 [Lentinula edodes]|nr:hypothetical protein F5879DRAFT_995214 [Lentinula edodes]